MLARYSRFSAGLALHSVTVEACSSKRALFAPVFLCPLTSAHLLHTTSVRQWDEYDNKRYFDVGEDAFKKVKSIMTHDFKRVRRRLKHVLSDPYKRANTLEHVSKDILQQELMPNEADVLIIGGGIIGSSIAFWLKQRIREEDCRIVVVECDDTFTKSATVLSAGSIRQQFSTPENVEMSLFGAEFLRHAGEHFRILDNDRPDLSFMPVGYLFLTKTPEGAAQMEENVKMQNDIGAKVKLMDNEQLKQQFPFMNFDGIIQGTYGLENEGVVDPWQYLCALREKNLTLGVQYVKARVEGFVFVKYFNEKRGHLGHVERPIFLDDEEDEYEPDNIHKVKIRPQKSDTSPKYINTGTVINAAGPWAGEIARMAGLGVKAGIMKVPVPVEPRKRYCYVFHCPDGPGLDMPMLIDPSGMWCRQEDSLGHLYLCGMSPLTEEEDRAIDHSNLDVDYDYFYEKVWPALAERVPAFEKLKIKSAWAGYYDYNYFDQNPVIGRHVSLHNFVQCCGFSGHGLQHAAAAGRGIMELIGDGYYRTIDLRRFDFGRLLRRKPLKERGVI